MNRYLCALSLLAAHVAIVILTTEIGVTEARPRFFNRGYGRRFGRYRVWGNRRPWGFRYFFRRRPRYYKTQAPPTTTMMPSTQPPTMCAPVQTCNQTDVLGNASNLYAAVATQALGVARSNAQTILSEFLQVPPLSGCATVVREGNVLTASLNPTRLPLAAEYTFLLLLNNDGNRVLQLNFTTRNFPTIGQVMLVVNFAGGESLTTSDNLVSIVRSFRPPGETIFFPLPLMRLDCETTQVCGEDVTQPPVTPTEPEPIQEPSSIPVLTFGDVVLVIQELLLSQCRFTQVAAVIP